VADPVLHVIAGPNGAGKTTFYLRVLRPATHLDFVNADVIAAERWPDAIGEHGYDAAELAAVERDHRIQARRSFATETVFSHESKLSLLHQAGEAGYLVSLHIILIPEDLAVARVINRVANGGHHVPEDKVRSRYGRLWGHLGEAVRLVDDARVYDNTRAAEPFLLVATYLDGRVTGDPQWPSWSPPELRAAGRRP